MRNDPASAPSEHPLEDIVEAALHASAGSYATVEDLMREFGNRSLGPIALLGGMVVMLPGVGMIPGIAVVIGAVLFLFSIQFIAGRPQIWLPARIRSLKFRRARLRKAKDDAICHLTYFDGWFKRRFVMLTGPVPERIAAFVVCALSLALIALDFVPGGVLVPGAAIVLLGVGLLAKDGLFMLFGFVASFGTLYLLLKLVPALFRAIF